MILFYKVDYCHEYKICQTSDVKEMVVIYGLLVYLANGEGGLF